jgi:hypothetical protein
MHPPQPTPYGLTDRETAVLRLVAAGLTTQCLRPGQLVTVDGTAGTVTLHAESINRPC